MQTPVIVALIASTITISGWFVTLYVTHRTIDRERAANIIVLVAPPRVINALMAFHAELKFSNPNRSSEGHDSNLKELLKQIRWNLRLPFENDPFDFHLITSQPTTKDV